MRKIDNEKGMVTMLVLIFIVFLMSFLISAYVLVSNKLRNQKEIIAEIKRIYEGTQTMDEIYESYIGTGLIPINSAESLVRIGKEEQYEIENKYYTLTKNATYILENDITVNSKEIEYLKGKDWDPNILNSINIEWNGKKITVIKIDGTKSTYDNKTIKQINT